MHEARSYNIFLMKIHFYFSGFQLRFHNIHWLYQYPFKNSNTSQIRSETFNTNLHYSSASFTLKLSEKSGVMDGF